MSNTMARVENNRLTLERRRRAPSAVYSVGNDGGFDLEPDIDRARSVARELSL